MCHRRGDGLYVVLPFSLGHSMFCKDFSSFSRKEWNEGMGIE